MTVTFTLNGKATTVDVPAEMPLLWVLRDVLDMKGTKFGCGGRQCGACTVHVKGAPTRSCITAISTVQGAEVRTIEGLSPDASHALQRAWLEAGCAAMRLLPGGPVHVGCGVAREDTQANRRADRRGDERQHLPLRHVPAYPAGDPPCGNDAGYRSRLERPQRQ